MRTLMGTSLALLLSACSVPATTGYHCTDTIALTGDNGWDFLTVDKTARRVYISHGTEVEVLNADSGKLEGIIPNTPGVHGIAIASDLGRGFISNGKSDTVTIFDLKTRKELSQVKTGNKPDAILYDNTTHRVFVFNGKSNNATVIDAATGKVAGTITLGGKPEFAVSDNSGHVFVNLEDKNKLLKIDARKLKILKRWSLRPGEEPSSLAIDQENHRLFVGCGNKLLIVINADNGKVVSVMEIGSDVDATAFDPATKLIISSNGEGSLTVIHEDEPDKYHVVETVTTPKRSKTFALDTKTHRLFVPTAQFNPAPAPKELTPKPRPSIVPGSFAVMVFDK